MPTSVMTLTAGVMIFVGSSRPPRPTSITATLTFSFAKQQNASAVPSSNSVICTPSFSQASTAGHTLSTSAASLSPAIGSPLMRMRSLYTSIYGEVYSPVLYPAARSMRSIIAQQEPLPFVPATCTMVSFSCGLPSLPIRARIFSRPFLQPVG